MSSKWFTLIESNENTSLVNYSFHYFKHCVTQLIVIMTCKVFFLSSVSIVVFSEKVWMKLRKNRNSPRKLQITIIEFYLCHYENIFAFPEATLIPFFLICMSRMSSVL